MKHYVLMLLCCWSLILFNFTASYSEDRELTASVFKHQQTSVIVSETASHVEEVHVPVIRV